MNPKLKALLESLKGKSLADQFKAFQEGVSKLFEANADPKAEDADKLGKEDMAAISKQIADLGAELKKSQDNAKAAEEAQAAQAQAQKDLKALEDSIAKNPAFAAAAAPGHTGKVPGVQADAGQVAGGGDLVDKFLSAREHKIEGRVLANTMSAAGVKMFEAHEKEFRLLAHDKHPSLSKLNAAFTSGGTPTSGTGLALTVTAIKTIRAFGTQLMPFSAFSTDFSPEAQVGTTLLSRVVPAGSPASDLNDTYNGDYLAAATTNTTTEISIDMTPHPVAGFSVTPDQFSNMASGVWPEVMDKTQLAKIYSIAAANLKRLFNLITSANFGAAILEVAPSSVNANLVANLGGTLKSGFGFQDGMMSLILNSTAYAALGTDSAIANNFASMNQVSVDGRFSKPVYGFNLHEAASLPYAGTTPATENLIGFACMPGGIALGMRVSPQIPQQVPGMVYYTNIQDPATGAVLSLSYQMDPNTRSLVVLADNRFGAAVGDSNQLKRITNP